MVRLQHMAEVAGRIVRRSNREASGHTVKSFCALLNIQNDARIDPLRSPLPDVYGIDLRNAYASFLFYETAHTEE